MEEMRGDDAAGAPQSSNSTVLAAVERGVKGNATSHALRVGPRTIKLEKLVEKTVN